MRKNILQKHKDIRDEYDKLFRQGLRTEVIIPRLAAKYYHTPTTIESILWNKKRREKEEGDNQLKLF